MYKLNLRSNDNLNCILGRPDNTGNSGMITKRYMAYPIEQSFKYNRLLLMYESQETLSASGREELIKKLDRFSDEDLRDALVMLTERELERLKSNL